MKLETSYIEKLAKIINDNGLTEISVESDDMAITVRKDASNIIPVQAPVIAAPKTVLTEPSAETTEAVKTEPKGQAITSPMVGTFYASPSPDDEPFVEIGTEIQAGDVVCIIEAMKLMNEIKSEHSGKITQICVKNGDPIEFGQVLMYVE
jgi:acetyl-CoA carboxylase biotin carboxyl carrier protein